MMHDEIWHALAAKKFVTYVNLVVNYCLQKDDPYRLPAPAAPVPAAPLQTCCGNTRQSKRPLSVLTVPCAG
jgi:hypothetical protein